MKRTGKLLALIAIGILIAVFVFTLCSCNGLLGGINGGNGGKNDAKLTAEYDTRYKVYVGDSLDTVKQYITVEYTDKDGFTNRVSDFELTGTIAEGDVTLTVRYQGLSTTVKVTVLVNTNPSNLGFNLIKGSDSYEISNVPSSVTELVIPSTYNGKAVTSISSSAFTWSNKDFTSITIPASIKQINGMCTTVESVYYEGTVADWCEIQFKQRTSSDGTTNPMSCSDKFYIKNNGEYTQLTNLVIPDEVESIGDYQFYGLPSLTSVSIPDSVTSIGDYVFYNCENINSLTIGNKVETIGQMAFYQCKSIESLVIPNSVTQLGNAAFYRCSGLTSLSLGNSITNIESSVFSDCVGLNTVVIPDSLSAIPDSTFYGCSGLTSITIGKGVKSITETAFTNCSALDSVYYNGTIADWCGIEFKDYSYAGAIISPMYYASKFYYHQSSENDKYTLLTDLVIPDGVTTIGLQQFSGFGELNSVTIPNTVTSLKTYAFYNCTFKTSATIPYCAVGQITAPTMVITNGTAIANYEFRDKGTIKSITLPDTLKSIGNSAFTNCWGLTSIEIPQSVTTIDEFAFNSCTNLESVSFYSDLTSIGDSAFNKCTKIKNVYYNGTLNDWFDISFGSETSNPVNGGECKVFMKDADSNESVELTSIEVPSKVTSIGEYQFAGFGVTSVEFHENIEKIGYSAFSNCKEIPSIILHDGVKEVGAYAFDGCSNVANISIPDTIEEVGACAFDGFKSSAYTRENSGTGYVRYVGNESNPYLVMTSASSTASSYAIHDGTKIIAGMAYYSSVGNSSLEKLTIPDSVKYIGEYAFYCVNLKTINYNGTIADWCDISINSAIFSSSRTNTQFCIKNASGGYNEITDLVIPEGVTSIGKYQFIYFKNITSVTLPESLMYIGESAFNQCVNVESIDIPNNVTEIAEKAFYQCTGLVNLTFGSSVETIGELAFYGCENLTSTKAPTSLVNLGAGAFRNCSEDFFEVYDNAKYWGNDDNPYWILVNGSSSTTTIHEDTKVIAVEAFSGAKIKSIVIPDSVEIIGELAFRNTSLTSIAIGSGVKYIGASAFYMSSSLTNVYYNGTVSDWCNIEIHDNVFQSTTQTNRFYVKDSEGEGYTEVTEIVIPDDVVKIHAEQFYAFNRITKIIIGKNITSIGRDAFDFCKQVIIIRYEGTVEEWETIEKPSWISTDMRASSVTCSDGSAGLFQ